MASTPTTKSQVQAYRFVLRRMESALVRKDAVMLHDPMGSHKRATVVGVIIAGVACVGFLVWGLFGGQGSVPGPESIVIGKQSGSIFVVAPDPTAQKRLIPMLNMASAKLLVMAQGGTQNGSPQATLVNDSALAAYPRAPETGIVNAPDYLPSPGNVAAPVWSVCDQAQGGGDVSTVVSGVNPLGTPLAPNQSLYVVDQTGQTYLVYVPATVPGQQNTGVVKAPVDSNQSAVMEMFGLANATPRPISTNLLNAIPTVSALTIHSIPGSGGQATYMHSAHSYRVGDVVKETVTGNTYNYYVLLRNGKQQVSEGAASVLNAAQPYSGDMPDATNAITNAPSAESGLLPVESFPAVVPRPVGSNTDPGACLTWDATNGNPRIAMTLNQGNSTPKPPVTLAQSDATGPNLDSFYLPPGEAAVVRGTENPAATNSGPLYLVSDQGVKYGIANVQTAQGLGVIRSAGDIKPAPASILATLPTGGYLDPSQASFEYDAITAPTLGVNRPLPSSRSASSG
jgi:type VII secretion protein EccB